MNRLWQPLVTWIAGLTAAVAVERACGCGGGKGNEGGGSNLGLVAGMCLSAPAAAGAAASAAAAAATTGGAAAAAATTAGAAAAGAAAGADSEVAAADFAASVSLGETIGHVGLRHSLVPARPVHQIAIRNGHGHHKRAVCHCAGGHKRPPPCI